jgi:hypothetical protein
MKEPSSMKSGVCVLVMARVSGVIRFALADANGKPCGAAEVSREAALKIADRIMDVIATVEPTPTDVKH